MNVNNVINHCLSLDFYKLQDFAGNNYQKVYSYLTKRYTGEQTNNFLIGAIFTCVAANGGLSDGEWRFISSFVGGYSYDDAFYVGQSFYNDEAQYLIADMIRALPTDVSEALLSLCLAVLAVDKRVDDSEVEFIRRLI